MKRLLFGLALISIATSSTLCIAGEEVKVAKEERTLYARDEYIVELLESALANTNYKFNHVPVHPHQQRTLLKLSQGNVDIHWGMTSPEREEIAIAVPVPIFKGLIGLRVALVKQGSEASFSNLETEQIKRLTAVQGHDWPDTKVLAQNGFRVKPFANYPAMFIMLARGQVDYFPRSVIEIQDELNEFNTLDLAIEQKHLFRYPTAFYFFVNKEKVALADQLELGLNKMIENGEFNKLFSQYFASTLSDLKLDERTVHVLKNDYLPSTVDLNREKLWYQKK